ncbi:MAG: sulfide/dihydroorotate dehydrogenase-like FAD/NAD-binding protein [bacterium]|jgi:ferredoxin--NADP+ reductase
MPFEIVEKSSLHETMTRIRVKAPLIAESAKPGQFIIFRLNELGERIPLTIADPDPASGTITLIFQKVGASTYELDQLGVGDFIQDVVGPLGQPTHIENFGTAIVVAGGLGTAELYPIARALKEAGNHVITIIGARNSSLLLLKNEMASVSHEMMVTTDDGSEGIKGVVTLPLKELLDAKRGDIVFACGPVIMMQVVSELTKGYGVPCIVSLNSIMVDGTGMCGACRVSVGGQTKFVCVDGPDFLGHDVDFELLKQRQGAFRRYEEDSMRRYKLQQEQRDHECKLDEAMKGR